MLRMLQADLKKYFRGKLFLSSTIIMGVFVILNLISGLVMKGELGEMLGSDYNAEQFFHSSYSLLSDFSLIFLIFMIIILASEFSQNTIRNKLIMGYDKDKIYLSTTFFIVIVVLATYTIYSVLNFIFTGIALGFSGSSLKNMLLHWIVYCFALLVIYTFIQLIVFIFKSTGITIGITIGGLFVTMIIVTIISITANDSVIKVLDYVFTIGQLGTNISFENLDMLWMILSDVVFTTGFIFLGLYANRKLDYK